MNMAESKRMLFLKANLFGYGKAIEQQFTDMGYEVDCINVSHLSTTFDRIVKGVPIFPQWKENRKVLDEYNGFRKDYDYVVAIRGDLLAPETIKIIKKENPCAKTILYLWDSVLENEYVKAIIPLFDEVMSFDMHDCPKYGFDYLPLFYSNDYKYDPTKEIDYKYLFSFVGTDHTDRHFILFELQKQANALGWDSYIHLRTSKLGYYKRRLKGMNVKKSDYKFESISGARISELYSQSKCVIDIENDVQAGLTMRTFEALASGKKLITTNKHIKETDLYHPNNVFVIDRKKPILDIGFINAGVVYNAAIENYSIAKWAENLLSNRV